MKITFLGVSTCIPDVGSEVASFVINERVLVDSGWCNVLKMRQYGLDPLKLEYVLLTHFHQDHYLGLAHLLFYLGMKQPAAGKAEGRKPLVLLGPAKYLRKIVGVTQDFLQLARFPELAVNLKLVPVSGGASFQGDSFQIDTFPGNHFSGSRKEESFICRFTENGNRRSLVFTGDTSFYPASVEFIRGAEMLIHDACHTAPEKAAYLARKARAGKLYLIHYSKTGERKTLAAARKVFRPSFLAREGKTVSMPPT